MAERVPKSVRVASVSRLSRSFVRLVVSGDSLVDFDPVHADSYVKVCFPDASQDRPRTRTYTVRAFDRATAELTLDFVVHGDSGLAGPWAASAQVGDEALLLGPGGGYSPSPAADFHVLVGDESALPAIAVALERVPADVPVHAFVEVHDAADELDLARPADVTWLHRGDGAFGSALVGAVTNWTAPAGDGHWFVHGEAGAVKALRTHLRTERRVPMDQLSISGYWRLGADDEAWRAVKRDWNREIEQAEAALA